MEYYEGDFVLKSISNGFWLRMKAGPTLEPLESGREVSRARVGSRNRLEGFDHLRSPVARRRDV